MRTTDNFDHDPPRKAAGDSRAAGASARNQAPRQPVRRPPVSVDDSYDDDDLRYDDEIEDQDIPDDVEDDDYGEQIPWYDSFWFICVCLVIFPPYALYRIWKDEHFTPANRWLVSAIDVCWMLIILILLFSQLFGRDNPVSSIDSTPTQGIDIPMPDPSTSPAATNSPDPNASAAPSSIPGVTPDPGASAAPTSIGGAIVLPTQLPGTTQLPSGTLAPGATLKPTAAATSSIGGTTSTTVWYNDGGTYYHSDKTCGGTMSGATQHTLAEAQAANKRRCPYCYDGLTHGGSTVTSRPRETVKPTVRATRRPTPRITAAPTPLPTPASTSPYAVMVYFTPNGECYHSKSNCQGMRNAGYHTIGYAIDSGKKRCPVCSAPEPGATITPTPTPIPTPTPVPTAVIHIVWYRPDSTYYHAISNCQGMSGATRHTLGEAIDASKPACPVCKPPKQ